MTPPCTSGRALSSCWRCYGLQATAGTFRMPCPPTPRLGRPLCSRDVGPTLEAVFHLLAVLRGRQQMPSRAKVLGDGFMRRQQSLGMPRRFQPLHAIFSLACEAMRVLATMIEVATLAMLYPG